MLTINGSKTPPHYHLHTNRDKSRPGQEQFLEPTTTHVGFNRTGWESTGSGHFGHGVMNNNGLRLLSFANTNNFIIGKTPNFNIQRNINSHGKIQQVMTQRCWITSWLTPVSVINLLLQRAKCKSHPLAKLNWKCLSDPAYKAEFQIALSSHFAALVPSEDINVKEQQVLDVIMESAKDLCHPTRCRTQP